MIETTTETLKISRSERRSEHRRDRRTARNILRDLDWTLFDENGDRLDEEPEPEPKTAAPYKAILIGGSAGELDVRRTFIRL